MNKKLKKGLNIASIVLICIVFVFGLIMIMMAFSKSKDGVPRVFGVSTIDILTDSMEGTINPGDLAIIKKVKDPSELEVGDIITYKTLIEGEPGFNTHRIVRIEGGRYFTKGDNKESEDVGSVAFSAVIGKYQFHIPKMGFVVRFLGSKLGFGLCIVLPLALFFAYRVFVLIRLLTRMKKEEKAAAVAAEDYDKLKQELEELRQRVGSDVKADSPPPDKEER